LPAYRRDGAPHGEVLRTYTVITTAANATMSRLHDRMPVILEAADWPAWLGEAAGDPAALMRPAAAEGPSRCPSGWCWRRTLGAAGLPWTTS
jgi:putative SOS response-associated peptidase YedK